MQLEAIYREGQIHFELEHLAGESRQFMQEGSAMLLTLALAWRFGVRRYTAVGG